MAMYAYTTSYSRGQSRRNTWAHEFEISLGKLICKKKKKSFTSEPGNWKVGIFSSDQKDHEYNRYRKSQDRSLDLCF